MRKTSAILLYIIIFFAFHFAAFAQVPQAISYQSVARNPSTQKVLPNQNISVRFSIRSGSASGPVQYSEYQTVGTTPQGLFNVSIGRGTPLSGSFSAIQWSDGNQWMEVSIDPNGGTNFTILENASMVSVPYAQYVETSASLPKAGPQGPTGAVGSMGVAGSIGPKGISGPTGPQGPSGLNGLDGVNGANGVNGTNGVNGATGPAGLAGVNGLNGATGSQGIAGVPGSAGPAGPPNMVGTKNRIAKFSSANTATNSQVMDTASQIGINTSTPHASSILDLSSTKRGFLLPRLTESQRDAIVNPATGLMIFNTNTKCINLWNGSIWKQNCFECAFTAPIAGNSGASCENDTLHLYASNVPGATYQWSGPDGFTSNQQNPDIIGATTAQTGTYSVVATVNGCTSAPSTTQVKINANPNSSFTFSPIAPSVFQGVSFMAPIAGATYQWTFINGNPKTSTAQNPVVTWGTIGWADVTLTVTLNGCKSTSVKSVFIDCPKGSTTLQSSCTPQQFIVPNCVKSIDIDLYGAAGGNGVAGNSIGGLGGRVTLTLTVTPGETLTVVVGKVGGSGNGGAGGCNLGGPGGSAYHKKINYDGGGGGGGETDIRRGGTGVADRIVVAGGGGGGGSDFCGNQGASGGVGGGLIAGDGHNQGCNGNPGGFAGTQFAGGQPGYSNNYTNCNASAGILGQGGTGNTGTCGYYYSSGGGGGGGGYYGGGGGGPGGGGGGSNYASPVGTSNVVHYQGVNSGDGKITISW